jgi:hypothetical protein
MADKSSGPLKWFIYSLPGEVFVSGNAVLFTRVARRDGYNLGCNSEIVKKYLIIALLEFVACAVT